MVSDLDILPDINSFFTYKQRADGIVFDEVEVEVEVRHCISVVAGSVPQRETSRRLFQRREFNHSTVICTINSIIH